MGEKTLNIRIKNKYDTEANWTKNNPVLLAGETAYSSDKSGKYKIGDGTHKWSELSYAKANLVKSDVTTALGYTPPTSNTWRGIQNNLTSDSTTDSLAAAQGKVLKALVDGKLPLTGGTLTGRLTIKGDAATSPLVVKGIAGSDGQGNIADLYLQYQTNSPIHLGNDGTYTISADGSLYSGTAANAKAIPWTGISGKPETYPPSSHTHNYAGSSSSGGIAWNASALYLNPQTRQTSANYDLTNSNTYAYRVNYSLATSAMTTGKPPADGHILTFGWDTDAGWGAQLCIGDAKDNHLYLRGSSSLKDSNNKNSSSWENWKTVLDSTNYNVYTPTKTGGGASGTWGISISGNSATATKLITARSINGVNFDGTAGIIVTANPTSTDTNNGNLNSFTTPGFYYGGGGNSCKNKPTDVSAFGLIVFKTAAGFTSQLLVEGDNAAGKMWIRQYNTYAWSGWSYVYTSSYKPSKSDVGLGSVDNTADANKSVKYATSAGSANAVTWANVSGKPTTFAPSSHTHNYAGSGSAGGAANSAVKLDSSAGSATQPVYFSGGKPVACSYTINASVPSGAKFTDTNTWRGVQNNLTSTAADQSLSAAQGKALNEKKLGAVTANGYIGMAKPDGTASDWIRTTSSGIIPYQAGSRGSGHGGIGTSSWYFASSYVDNSYVNKAIIADKVSLQYDTTSDCLNFVFS